MLARTWFSKGQAIVVLSGAMACLCFGISAADLGDADLITTQVWYQPTLMSSVDEAAGTINSLRSSFTDWRGGTAENVFATRTHVDIHTNIHVTEQNSQWVPSWGGVVGPGGSYTPYSGGSMQTTQNERDEPADLSLVPGEIVGITLWSYPNLQRDYKFGFNLQFSRGNAQSVMAFRTPNVDVARRLADAFATLAAANFTDGHRFSPSLGIQAQTKDLPSQYSRLNWAQATGLVIDAVVDESPAAAAGLAHDDIVFEADGKPVTDAPSVSKIATDFLRDKPEGSLDLKVFRGGQTIPMQVALTNPNVGIEKLLPAQAPAPALAPTPIAPTAVHLGIAARNLTAAEAKKAGLASGVLVVGVDAGSLAQQMDLKAGDFLLEINGAKVADMSAMKQALSSGSVDVVKVWRKGKVLTLNGVSKM
ncbi:MAG: PDZ domain-containing protein [Rhizomicrobium sp.]|jgi:S1-C subfamily serine protease